jgi:SseB protein C-terminal domain
MGAIGAGKPHLIVGLVNSTADESQLSQMHQSLANAAKQFIPQGEYLDFMALTGSILETVRKMRSPFYTRQ